MCDLQRQRTIQKLTSDNTSSWLTAPVVPTQWSPPTNQPILLRSRACKSQRAGLQEHRNHSPMPRWQEEPEASEQRGTVKALCAQRVCPAPLSVSFDLRRRRCCRTVHAGWPGRRQFPFKKSRCHLRKGTALSARNSPATLDQRNLTSTKPQRAPI